MKDLIKYAVDKVIDSTQDLEELYNWDAFGIAEDLATEIEYDTNIELNDKDYHFLIEMLERFFKKHTEEIDEGLYAYERDCEERSRERYETLRDLIWG